jgi:tape measure domain-containing protein
MALNLGNIFYQLGVNTSGLNKASRDVKNFETGTTRSFNNTEKAADRLKTTFATLISLEALRRTAVLADEYQLLGDKLNAVVTNTDEATVIFSRLEGIAEKTGASLETTIGGFQKLAFAKNTVQGTNEEMIALTQAFMDLSLISGTGGAQLEGAMLQFSQGLVTGTFQAQEFQSVMENIPAILPQVAKGMGITTEEVIKLKKEGKLVSEEVFRALLNQTDEISKMAEDMPIRLTRGWGRFTLGIQQGLGDIDKMLGITQKIASWLFIAGEYASNLPTYFEASVSAVQRVGINLIAASEAAQKLIAAAAKLLNLDLSGAIEEIKGMKEAFEEARESANLSVHPPDLSPLEVYYAEVERITNEHNSKMASKAKKAAEEQGEIKQQQSFTELKWEEYKNKTMASFKMNAGKKETEIAGENFRKNLEGAAQYSKEFAALSKAMALFDLAVKTPQAIGAAFTYGNSIGGPIAGAAMAALAGAAMGVQIAGVASQNFTPRAIGGDIFPNQTYLVGENGPELLNLGGSARGSITTNGDMNGMMGMSSPPKVTVNVYPIEGETATITQTEDSQGGLQIDILMKQIDTQMAQGIQRGTSQVSQTLSNTFGLNRAVGALI